jgi:uncharacterized repeat protein (TIGR01451 family)
VTKTADNGPFSAGDSIGFTISASNTGQGDLLDIVVTDNLPAGYTWFENSADCSIDTALNPDKLTCTFGTIAAGGPSKTVHISGVPTDPESCGLVSNTAVGTSNNGGSSANASLTVDCPDITISKVADDATVSAGDPIGFRIVVGNNGPGTARSYTLNDPLPAGVDWSIETPVPGCSINTNTNALECAFGDLVANASRTVDLTAQTNEDDCATYNNTATADAANDGPVQASASTTVQCPDIGITKRSDNASVSAGDQIGFVIEVTNAGPGVAKGFTMSDTLPSGGSNLVWTESPDNTDCSIAGSVLTCSFGDVGPNDSRSVHVVATTTKDDCSTINNTAFADATNDAQVSASSNVVVKCANIVPSKQADDGSISAGDQIGFTVGVTNTGEGIARDVAISDNLPAGLTWSESPDNVDCDIAAGVLTCDFGDLAPQASRSVHVVATTTQANCGTINNTAFATTSNDGGGQAGASVIVLCPAIQVDKTPDAGTIAAGEQAVFTVGVTNTGAGEAKDVDVSDVLPNPDLAWSIDPAVAGCSISEIVGGPDDGKSRLDCTFATLASGATKTIVLKANVPAAECATLDNTATADASNADPDSDSGQIRCFDSKAIVVKSGNEVAYHDDNVTFTYVVTNPGNNRLHDVVVTDDKCSPVTGPAKVEGPNNSGGDFLDPGDTWTYSCTMGIPAHSGGEANPLKNIVTVTAKDDRNSPVGATDDHLTRILHPAIDVDKTGPAEGLAGQPVTYAIAVTNPGDVSFASGAVSVQDALCEAPPLLVADGKRRGDGSDASPDTLDPGDMWVYSCTVQTLVGQQRVDNVADVAGTDSNGRRVSDSDPATTILTQPVQQIAPQRIQPGAARLQGPSTCVLRPFSVIVRGLQIDNVTLFIAGKRVRTLRAQQARLVKVRAAQSEQAFSFRIDPRKLKRGRVHRVTARVVFNTASGTQARNLRLAFQRCRAAAKPKFTG